MEIIQSDEKGHLHLQRRANQSYVFLLLNDAYANCFSRGDNNGVLLNRGLLPNMKYLMITEEEWRLTLQNPAIGANPVPGPAKASDANVRASRGAVQSCIAINTGNGLGTIVCAVHGPRWKSISDCGLLQTAVQPAPAVAQVGGAHYQRPGVQHWDYACNLGYLEGQVSRYVDRYNKPGGYGAKDLLKSLSYLLKLLEMRYPERWREHEELLHDMQTRLADVYKAECAVPKREAIAYVPPDNVLLDDGALGEPLQLFCPNCKKKHIDEGEWKTRPHKTHRCVNDTAGPGCGHEWRPSNNYTVGVEQCINRCGRVAADNSPYCTDCMVDQS